MMAHIYNSQLDAYSIYHIEQESPGSLLSHHHHRTSHKTPTALPALGHAISGSTGTAISNLATYPLSLIITRLQVNRVQQSSSTDTSPDESYDGILDAAQKIYNRDGLAGFYAGVIPDTAKSVTDSFLFFLFYNYLRTRRLSTHNSRNLNTLDELAIGAAASALSKLLTTPLSNIATRAQTSRNAESLTEIAAQIHREKGVHGFWGGYSASLVLTLNPSLTFFFFESLKRLLPRSKREDPGASLTFLLAALSKAGASGITYPFSLAKTRAQVSSAPVVEKSASELKGKAKADLDSAAKSAASAKNVGKKDLKRAADATVFSTVLRIYRDEGIEALYVGLGAEVLKSFFSHGITMLVKDQVHGWVIKLYFVLLKAYRRISPGEQIRTDAYERASELARKQAKRRDAFSRAAERIRRKGGSDEGGSETKAHPVSDGVAAASELKMGARSVMAGRAHSVYDQAVKGSKDQMSMTSSEPAEMIGRRMFVQDVDSHARVAGEGPGGVKEADEMLGGVGSTWEMEMLRQRKGGGN